MTAVVATSDDPTASQRIARFAHGTSLWLVAVRMVSEGVDVPRLRVGVYATTTTTELFFRQAVGRFVRATPGPADQRAVVYLPDDPRLRAFAGRVQEQRRHALRRAAADEDLRRGPDEEAPPREDAGGREPQLSLFAPISAVALDAEGLPIRPGAPALGAAAPGADAEDDSALDAARRRGRRGAAGRLATNAPAASPAAAEPTASAEPPLTRRQRRQQLRDRNAEKVRLLARLKRLSHLEVNAELNRRAGIRRVDEATEEQLERRLAAAEAWLARR